MTPSEVRAEAAILRTEVIASQSSRIDLLKYKLLAIATLGGIGLGFAGGEVRVQSFLFEPAYLLCVLPFTCAFIDLLCMHNTIRILIIGRFLAMNGDAYECFIDSLGKPTNDKIRQKDKHGERVYFELEDWALQWSSILLSLLLLTYGVYLAFRETHLGPRSWMIFAGSGIIGIILSVSTVRAYRRRVDLLLNATGKTVAAR
jgi:hypothetical protein